MSPAPALRQSPSCPWVPQPWIQFDVLLDRIVGQYDHQNRNIPIFNDLLIARLCQMGLNTGRLLSIDGFVERPEVLEGSLSDVFIACTVDQWYSEAFLHQWVKLKKRYACKVLITLEPIFTPLSMYDSPARNARERHQDFLRAFDPDIILYNSLLDCEAYRALGLGHATPLHYIQADPMELSCPALPWEEKHPALLFTGNPVVWENSRPEFQGWTRTEQLNHLASHAPLPVYSIHEQFTHRACYDLANLFRFQLSPRSGYTFHPPRVIQSALVGSIPVILIPRNLQEHLFKECPLLREDKNCLVGYDGEYEALFRKLKNDDLCREIALNVGELLGMGTFQDSIRTLVTTIQDVLRGSPVFGDPEQAPIAPVAVPPHRLIKPVSLLERLLWFLIPGLGKRRRRKRREVIGNYKEMMQWGHRSKRPWVFFGPPADADPAELRRTLLEGNCSEPPLLKPFTPARPQEP